MFDNPQEELRRLQNRLLEEEENREAPEETEEQMEVESPAFEEDWLEDARRFLEEEPAAARPGFDETRVYATGEDAEPRIRNYANGYGKVQNRDRADLDLEEYSDRVYEAPREKGLWGLVILACLETLGIVAVVAYWLVALR